MKNTKRSTRSPRLFINPSVIATHLETLDNTALCATCRDAVIPVTTDTVALLIEAIRLSEALHHARLESANRLAAIRAALHAHAEGEPDPLTYLHDELADTESPGADSGWRP